MEGNKYEVDVKFTMGFDPQKLSGKKNKLNTFNSEYKQIFKSLDSDKDGVIERSELLTALHNMGYRTVQEADVVKMISEVDLNKDSSVQFSEFLQMMKNFNQTGMETKFTKLVDKTGKNLFRVGEDNKSFSTFSEEERSAYVRVINSVLGTDEVCMKYLPINPDSMDVFSVLKNGVLLCKLINKAAAGTIDERVINTKENMNIFLQVENLRLALNAAKSVGCKLIGIFHETIQEENYVLILGLLWQVVRLILVKEINLKKIPQLIRLLQEGEQLTDLLKMNPEDLLIRWFNFHLASAGYAKKLANFSSDVKDSEKYVVLLNQLNKELCDKSALAESDLKKRAALMLESAKKLGVDSFVAPNDIVSGNLRLNILLTAAIFNHCHGLDPPTEEEYEAAKLLEDDAEGSREERTFRMWINSMGLPDLHANNLYEDSKSGVLLLKVIDKLKPNLVDWKKVDEKTTNKFKKLVNCNECVDASKKAGFSIVGVGGSDILEGNKKLVLGIVWQLMRCHSLQVIGGKTEDDILKWANDLVGAEHKVTSFRDASLKNSLFFIRIMNAIEARAINWDLVMQGKQLINNLDDAIESLENNAKYALSIARKLGACVFFVWEDIKDVKSKMLVTFAAALYDVYLLNQKMKAEKNKLKQDD